MPETTATAGATVPSPPRAAVEEHNKEAEVIRSPPPVASPAQGTAPDEPHQHLSPGQGSGTKEAEDELIRTSAGEDATAMTRNPPPRANSPPPAQTLFPLASSSMTALESLSMAGLRNEYLTRLTQHGKLEGELVKMMHRRHEVNMLLLPVAFGYILPYIL